MKHFHNYTEPWCNSNYPFQDDSESPVRRRAEIKDDTKREARRRRRNEAVKQNKGRQEEEGEGEFHKENNVLVKCLLSRDKKQQRALQSKDERNRTCSEMWGK